MEPDAIAVEALPDYQLSVIFNNGEKKVFDCKPYLDYPAFRELQNESYFTFVKVGQGSVCWPNGQDIAPETLYLESRIPNPEVA